MTQGDDKIAIFGKIVESSVDGPGTRAVIHFAGCSIGCPGCFNPLTHDATAPGVWYGSAKSIARRMLAVSDSVTISGGEPTDQLESLFDLCVELRAEGCNDIVLFTGKKVSVHERKPLWNKLIRDCLVDVVVDGPFKQGNLAIIGLRGSDNQEVIPITERWTVADFNEREVEITLDFSSGGLLITGFPDQELLDLLA